MDLVAAFNELGVSEPEAWAASQVSEGIDQLSRATILRAFADVANSAPSYWHALASSEYETDEVQASAKRLADMNIPVEDLERVVKATVSQAMFDVCALLDGSAEPEVNPGGVMFGAFPVKEEGDDFEPVSTSLGLHESWNEVAAAILGKDVVIE